MGVVITYYDTRIAPGGSDTTTSDPFDRRLCHSTASVSGGSYNTTGPNPVSPASRGKVSLFEVSIATGRRVMDVSSTTLHVTAFHCYRPPAGWRQPELSEDLAIRTDVR
jgi:hypothetical protein